MNVLFVIFLGFELASQGAALPAKETLEKLSHGDTESAVIAIQTLGKKDEQFSWGLQEIARVYYKENRWQEFFGIAYYSRKALPAASLEGERIRLMEVLALLRHCQNDQATEVMKLRPYSQDPALRKHFLVLAELLQIPATVKGPSDGSKKMKGLFPNANLWPVADLSLEKIGPYRLRRTVEPKCERGKP